jgi:hypothetical protein
MMMNLSAAATTAASEFIELGSPPSRNPSGDDR